MLSGNMFRAADIAASGLKAERMRMEVATSNIANSHATSSPNGGPYRRQQVIFSSVFDETDPFSTSGSQSSYAVGGVEVVGIESDPSEFPSVYQPGHPDADESGMVSMPNVVVPMELVDLMTASRAYEANLKSMEMFRKMAEQTLTLMRGVGG
ncbi:flagellar basal body rod protein FlgC [Thalassoglobus sp. JC818]|uniref:flagellar basal body rod protein FlgC n=1 Tax=Thalassoglobus sp. JC818 TaxID=3232136 RepID=UPI003457AF1A